MAIEADLEASPWEGEGTPQGLGSASGLSWHPCFPQAGAPGDAREQPALRPIAAAAVAEIPMSVRASPMPPTSCGARTAFGCSRWTTAGAGYSPPSSIGTPSASAHVCKRGDRFAALQPISMGPRLYASTSAGAARGLALRMDHGSQYLSDHFTNQIVLGHPAVLHSPRPTASPRGSIATDHPWPHLPQHRGAAERRPRVRRTVQCPVDRGEERLPEPRSSSSGVAHRDVTQARRMRQTCVQGTGCDTATTLLPNAPCTCCGTCSGVYQRSANTFPETSVEVPTPDQLPG